jgi:hypothetical protein
MFIIDRLMIAFFLKMEYSILLILKINLRLGAYLTNLKVGDFENC